MHSSNNLSKDSNYYLSYLTLGNSSTISLIFLVSLSILLAIKSF